MNGSWYRHLAVSWTDWSLYPSCRRCSDL